jgi:hypothetical protein
MTVEGSGVVQFAPDTFADLTVSRVRPHPFPDSTPPTPPPEMVPS